MLNISQKLKTFNKLLETEQTQLRLIDESGKPIYRAIVL